MKKISKGKRRHLLALWLPRARAQEQREADRAASEAWLREFNGRRWGVLPRDARIELLTLDTSGGTVAIFESIMAEHDRQIVMSLLSPRRAGNVGLYVSPQPRRVTS